MAASSACRSSYPNRFRTLYAMRDTSPQWRSPCSVKPWAARWRSAPAIYAATRGSAFTVSTVTRREAAMAASVSPFHAGDAFAAHAQLDFVGHAQPQLIVVQRGDLAVNAADGDHLVAHLQRRQHLLPLLLLLHLRAD